MIGESEETLDPGSWTELRRLGHRMIDDMVDYIAGLRREPVWRPMPGQVRARFRPRPHCRLRGLPRAGPAVRDWQRAPPFLGLGLR